MTKQHLLLPFHSYTFISLVSNQSSSWMLPFTHQFLPAVLFILARPQSTPILVLSIGSRIDPFLECLLPIQFWIQRARWVRHLLQYLPIELLGLDTALMTPIIDHQMTTKLVR